MTAATDAPGPRPTGRNAKARERNLTRVQARVASQQARAEFAGTLNALEDKLNVPKQVGIRVDRAKAQVARVRRRAAGRRDRRRGRRRRRRRRGRVAHRAGERSGIDSRFRPERMSRCPRLAPPRPTGDHRRPGRRGGARRHPERSARPRRAPPRGGRGRCATTSRATPCAPRSSDSSPSDSRSPRRTAVCASRASTATR